MWGSEEKGSRRYPLPPEGEGQKGTPPTGSPEDTLCHEIPSMNAVGAWVSGAGGRGEGDPATPRSAGNCWSNLWGTSCIYQSQGQKYCLTFASSCCRPLEVAAIGIRKNHETCTNSETMVVMLASWLSRPGSSLYLQGSSYLSASVS